MKEINIATVLVNKRREKGVTQDELASYIGVSKSSVSKWETNQSYPDITFLPRLATYFNISIDDLISYKPQMTKEEIRQLYQKLATDFSSRSFHEVMNDCREMIKEYFSCFPLLLQMGILILNHSTLAKGQDEVTSCIEEAKAIFIRVKEESGDVELSKQALHLEAVCCISLGDPNTTLELLKKTNVLSFSSETLIASAYQMIGKMENAKSTLQIGIYQHIVSLLSFFSAYLPLCVNDAEMYEEVVRRGFSIVDAFQIKTLHPTILMNLYISAAQGYVIQGNTEKTLAMLNRYVELVTSDIYPLCLQGDDFFSLLDDWIAEFDLGTDLPRNEKIVKQSMVEAIANNPAFSTLANEQSFQRIVEELKNNC